MVMKVQLTQSSHFAWQCTSQWRNIKTQTMVTSTNFCLTVNPQLEIRWALVTVHMEMCSMRAYKPGTLLSPIQKCQITQRNLKNLPQPETSSSAIAERPRNARVISIRKISKWNFWVTLCRGA